VGKYQTKSLFLFLHGTAPKSRIIPKAFGTEATVVLKLNIAASDKRAVIVCWGPFLVTFLGKQKSDSKNKRSYYLFYCHIKIESAGISKK
jgi:hypothetical protein